MKRIIQILFCLLTITACYSQVGINTENPSGIFHIDAMKNTSGTTNISDDVLIDATGNMGIGTTSPSSKLEIISTIEGKAIKILDGSEGVGKVLTSNSLGEAKWMPPGRSVILGSIPDTPIVIDMISPDINSCIAYSGMSIDLPRGDFQINFSVWFAPTGDAALNGFPDLGSRFSSVFLSTSSTQHIAPTYLYPLRSIMVPRLFNVGSPIMDYYGSGAIPVRIEMPTTLYVWIFMHSSHFILGNPNRKVISYNGGVGSFGPYTQLYAIPFYVE